MLARRLVFVLVVLISLVMLFSPGAATPDGPAGSDKLVHAGLFALLTWTGLRAAVSPAWLGAALLGYAVGSEFAQAILPIGRHGTATDVVADAVGACAVLALALAAHHSSRRAPPTR